MGFILNFWLIYGLFFGAEIKAQEKPKPSASINILDPEAALPYALFHLHEMAKGKKCKKVFEDIGADIEKEVTSGDWTLVWIGPLAGESGGRVIGITSCLGYKTIGLTPSAFVFGPVQVGLTILHEMAHVLGCKKGSGLSEKKASKISFTCYEEYRKTTAP